MKKITDLGTLIAAGLAIIMTTLSPLQAAPLDPSAVKQPKMSPALNVGKLNYEAKCAKCHGKNIAGTDKGPTFLHRVYHPGHHGDGAPLVSPSGIRVIKTPLFLLPVPEHKDRKASAKWPKQKFSKPFVI